MSDHSIVYVIDDDQAVRESLAFLLDSAGISCRTFASAIAFLNVDDLPNTGVVVSDIRMPDMDGLAFQRKLRELRPNLPLILITGHGDIPIAVEALKAGAMDFLEKPFEDDHLLAAIDAALAKDAEVRQRTTERAEIEAHLHLLTPREQEVLEKLVAGHQNKVIAHQLGMSPRTVEVHRARVMEKMQVRGLSELVRKVLTAQDNR